MDKKDFCGGDVIYELRNLAVPFTLLLAKNGMDYIQKKGKTTKTSTTKAPPKQVTKRGGCGCMNSKSSVRLGGEIEKLAQNLNTIMNSYKT